MNLPRKGLTLHQPWAILTVLGEKHVETRSWKTKYRGPIAIHSSSTLPGYALALALSDSYFVTALGKYPIERVALGAIIGTVTLVAIERTQDVIVGGKERAFGDYTPDRWAWLFDNPVHFEEPLPWKGALGLWAIDS